MSDRMLDIESERSKFFDDATRLVEEISQNQTFYTVKPLLNFWAAFTPSAEVSTSGPQPAIPPSSSCDLIQTGDRRSWFPFRVVSGWAAFRGSMLLLPSINVRLDPRLNQVAH